MLVVKVQDAVATVGIKRDPVNSLNTQLWTALLETLDQLEKDKSVRALVIYSALERQVFSAGNDLMELVASKTTEERFVHFWTISNTFLARLLNSRLLTVACLKGAAPAGGLAIAMCCDFRISTSNTTTGLNEVSIGLSVPPIWMQRLTQLVGHGNTERISQLSFMIQAKEAKQIGLFDEVVENEQDLLPKASAFLKKILAYPDAGRLITKSSLRNDLAKQWGDVGRIQQEARSNFKILQQPQNVKVLEAVLKRLSKPKL